MPPIYESATQSLLKCHDQLEPSSTITKNWGLAMTQNKETNITMSHLIGTGTSHDPLVIAIPPEMESKYTGPLATMMVSAVSAGVQKTAINGFFGENQWELVGRDYSDSPNAPPGNGNLCEWVVSAKGSNWSIWFDLADVNRVLKKYALPFGS